MQLHSRNSEYGRMAFKLCRGKGVEVGALHKPFDLDASVIYVDRYSTSELKELYDNDPRGGDINPVQIVCHNNNYDFFDDNAFDFVISSHVLERTPNPGRVLEEWLRIIKPGGHVYFVIPNMRYTQDKTRELTGTNVLLEKFESNTTTIDYKTYHDAIINVDARRKVREEVVQRAFEEQKSIAVHTFTLESIKDFIKAMESRLGCSLVHQALDGIHIHIAVKKISAMPRAERPATPVKQDLPASHVSADMGVPDRQPSMQNISRWNIPVAGVQVQKKAPSRKSDLLHGLDLKSLCGVEIGPLDKPIVFRNVSNILYADHADTQSLRNKYAADTAVDIKAIPDIDIVLSGNNLAEHVGRGTMDYIVASHVIEHTPDFIGYLLDCFNALKAGGVLCLAVPDCRYTFDVFRRQTFFEDVEIAHTLQAKRPSIDQVIDHAKNIVELDLDMAWKDYPRALELASLKHVRGNIPRLVEMHQSGQYLDVHCWIFTPWSFLNLVKKVFEQYDLPVGLRRFIPTRYMKNEFIVQLEKLPDFGNWAESWSEDILRAPAGSER